MFIHYRSQGFILGKEERAEANQLFTVFTKDFGKLEILGKAIRKISSKLKSGAEIFYLSEIEFIQGKIYKTLTDAILIEKFQNLRKSLNKLNIAYKISETLDDFIKGQEPDEKIWQLLKEIFYKLDDNKLEIENCCVGTVGKLKIIYHYFFWNLISILGYKPEIYVCPLCQKKLKPENLHFSEKEGGIVCQNCSKSLKSATQIEPEIVKILRVILSKNWKILLKLNIENKHLKSLNAISKNYSLYILGKNKQLIN